MKFKNITKNMTLKEKISYIWEYYRFYILGVIVSILIIFSLINIIFLNPAPKTYLGIAINDYPFSNESLIQIESELNETFINKKDNLIFRVDNFYTSDDPTFSMGMEQRFVANLSVNEIDILISKADSDQISNELFINLEEIFSKDELNELGENFFKNSNGDIIGIYTQNSKLINKYNLNYENQIIGIYYGTKKPEKAKEVFKYFVK